MSLNIPIQDFYDRHVKNLKPAGNGQLKGLCPFHDDKNPSLSVNLTTGSWYCFACVEGGGPENFAERLGVSPPDDGRANEIEVVYDYKDEKGLLLFQVVRFQGKQYRQRRPDGSGGWIWGIKDVRRVLYRLPELQGKATVYVIEGEKDADRLWGLGIPATTCPMGAGKWRDEYTDQLKASGVERVVILPDNDDEGRKHAEKVARSCIKADLQVKTVHLPDLPPKGDVSDWLGMGHTRADLAEIVKNTPLTTREGLTDDAEGVDKPLVRLIRASEFTAPPVSWVLDGLVPAGMVTLLSGRDTVGKTLLALEVSRAVLTGQPLLEHWPVSNPGPVVAILLDDARSTIKERLVALGIKDHPDLCIAPYDEVDLSAGAIGMLAELESKALQRKAKLIVLDSLWHFIPSRTGAANDQGLMRPLMQRLVRLAGQTGAGVLLVAHDRKAGDDVAGSHIIRAASKTILRLTLPRGVQVDPDELPDTPDRVLRFESNLAHSQTWRLRLEGVGAWTFLGTHKEYHQGETERTVLDYLNGGGQGTVKEIATELGRREGDVRGTLRQLEDDGAVQCVLVKTGGAPKKVYRVLPTSAPEDTSQPEGPDEKSQGQLIELQNLGRHWGFPAQLPAPRG